MSRTRAVVIYGSFVLAVCGWGGAAWSWLDHGYEAGVNPGYIMALSVAITFTITLAVTVVLPDMARMYALGLNQGVEIGRDMADEPAKLRSVR